MPGVLLKAAVLLLRCRTNSQDEEGSPNVLVSLPKRSAAEEPEGKCLAINKVRERARHSVWPDGSGPMLGRGAPCHT